jgi:hypothetical protein
MNLPDVRKKEHPARRLSTLYVEGIDVPLKKVQENRENDIYIRSHQNAENYLKI